MSLRKNFSCRFFSSRRLSTFFLCCASPFSPAAAGLGCPTVTSDLPPPRVSAVCRRPGRRPVQTVSLRRGNPLLLHPVLHRESPPPPPHPPSSSSTVSYSSSSPSPPFSSSSHFFHLFFWGRGCGASEVRGRRVNEQRPPGVKMLQRHRRPSLSWV